MRERKPLKQNTELRVTNQTGGTMCYVVGDVVGFGGTCIVYDGYYRNNAGTIHTIRIKECFPYKLHITRNEQGELLVPDNEREKFEVCKNRFRKSFDIANSLHETSGLTNLTSNVFDRYEANHTVYIICSYTEGNTLADKTFDSLKDAVRVVLSTAKSIEKIHHQGYLYLDIKPQNIMVYSETLELVQLFDFDSLISIDAGESISEYKISYSPGFAPVEQKMGDFSKIGKHTDVYSIGALLFYLLFGNAPGVMDCGTYTMYDYTKLRWDDLFQDKLYKELTIFFHHTLQAYQKDRYQEMSEVIGQLQVIEKYADMPVPFICSGYVVNQGQVIGREKECEKLSNWYCGDEKLIFVTGMGGIGKSTIVRKFVSENRERFEHVVYVQYKESICETIADDKQFCVNGYEKDAEESTKEYFERKLKVAKNLATDTDTLLVIDNFAGPVDEDFAKLLHIGWKIIVVTRSDMSVYGNVNLKVESFREKDEFYQLFESYLGRKLRANEYHKLDRMIEGVAGHTLVLTLIAKQIANSYLDIGDALKLAEEHGFAGMAPEKVNYTQDGQMFYDKVSSIIKGVYDVSFLSEEKKKILKILSLFDFPGIDVKAAKNLLQLESFDEMNELRDLGWLEVADHYVQMHPLIQETIHQIPWTDEHRTIALEEMQALKQDIVQELSMAKSVLLHCGKDEILASERIYKELLFTTLMNSPKEQEDYIVRNAERYFKGCTDEPLYSIMELYDYTVYLLCQKKHYSEAQRYLQEADLFSKKSGDHYIRGLYYDMLGDYQDALLSGAYDAGNEAEQILLNQLLTSMDKAIYHMKKAKHDNAKKLCIKYLLSKAALMIRSVPEKKRKIEALVKQVEKMIEKHVLQETEVRVVCDMIWAWFYTLCKPGETVVLQYLQKAEDANECRGISDLDKVDDFYIPAANMMYELGNVEMSLNWLEEAFGLCDAYEDVLPYIRKKLELLECELDVYESENDRDGCRETLKRMDYVKHQMEL